MEKFFKIKERGSTVKTEIIAGATTFMTMIYILAVNPAVLSETGMDKGALFTATALSAAFATLVMALVANLPFALAPGMSASALFTYTIVLTMGYPWQLALTAVFLEGIIFLLLTFFNVRELIVDSIPMNIKRAIAVGIGLFIAFIGFQKAQWVTAHPVTLVQLNSLITPQALVAAVGLLGTSFFLILKMRGALLLGILTATAVGAFVGVTHIFEGSWRWFPPSLSPLFLQFDWSFLNSTSGKEWVDFLAIIFTLLFLDMFDTVGTLVGVAINAGMVGKKGKIPRLKRGLLADAAGTTVGACLGTSTVTTYVESAAGVEEGGRTGLTALTVAFLFLVALFFAPLFFIIPGEATAGALIIVGFMMMRSVKSVEMKNLSEAIPAFLTLIMMPLSFNIADGLGIGIISFVVLKFFAGKIRQAHPGTIVVALIFLLRFIFY